MTPVCMQIVPTRHEQWAVLTDDDGKPVFCRVLCHAIYALGMDKDGFDQRVVCGVTDGNEGGHMAPLDFEDNFVGYADKPDTNLWSQRCVEKRAELVRAAAELKASKLYVPGKKSVVEAVGKLTEN